MATVNVKINNEVKVYPDDMLIKDIAREYADNYKNDIIAVFRNNKVCELNKTIKCDCELEFITTATDIGNNTYVRGVVMMLLKAFYAEVDRDKLEKICLESTIGNGYYCEIRGDINITDDMLSSVEKRMMSYVDKDIVFEKSAINTDDAVKLFASLKMTDKEKLFKYRRSSKVNVYSLDGFIDYYYGAMPPSTGMLKYFELKKYGEGFVLVVPGKDEPETVKEFVSKPKFYNIIKETNDWLNVMDVDTVGALNDMIVAGKMKDLVLIQEALHEKKIGDIAASIAEREDVKFVMIAGPSSSGKTTFSHRLSIQLSTLGLKPHPIAVDDYFVNRDQTPLNEDGSYNYECLEAIDVEQFNKDMTSLMNGEEIELPTFNFVKGEREYKGKRMKLHDDEILVIEGIHGLNDKLSYSLPKESKYKIYISALTQLNIDEHNRIPTTDGRLIRRIVRDARTRGTNAQKTIAMWNSVRNGEKNYIFPFQEDADAMFNSALVYELAILKQYAEPLLFNVDRNSPEYVEAKRLLKFLEYFIGVSSENVISNSILREFIGGSILPV